MADFRDKQIEEANRRLKMLERKGLHPNVRSEFRQNVLNYSERTTFPSGYTIGTLYWISEGSGFSSVIDAFEDEWDAVVYHATLEQTEFGRLLDIFYVSKSEEEWEADRSDIEHGRSVCYVYNLDCANCSEFGTIAFETSGGGLVRTA